VLGRRRIGFELDSVAQVLARCYRGTKPAKWAISRSISASVL
jgi:hypothetical protein